MKASIHFEHDLPRPGTASCPLTIDDVWTDVCDVWWTKTTSFNTSFINWRFTTPDRSRRLTSTLVIHHSSRKH